MALLPGNQSHEIKMALLPGNQRTDTERKRERGRNLNATSR